MSVLAPATMLGQNEIQQELTTAAMELIADVQGDLVEEVQVQVPECTSKDFQELFEQYFLMAHKAGMK